MGYEIAALALFAPLLLVLALVICWFFGIDMTGTNTTPEDMKRREPRS